MRRRRTLTAACAPAIALRRRGLPSADAAVPPERARTGRAHSGWSC